MIRRTEIIAYAVSFAIKAELAALSMEMTVYHLFNGESLQKLSKAGILAVIEKRRKMEHRNYGFNPRPRPVALTKAHRGIQAHLKAHQLAKIDLCVLFRIIGGAGKIPAPRAANDTAADIERIVLDQPYALRKAVAHLGG